MTDARLAMHRSWFSPLAFSGCGIKVVIVIGFRVLHFHPRRLHGVTLGSPRRLSSPKLGTLLTSSNVGNTDPHFITRSARHDTIISGIRQTFGSMFVLTTNSGTKAKVIPLFRGFPVAASTLCPFYPSILVSFCCLIVLFVCFCSSQHVNFHPRYSRVRAAL